MNDPETIDPRRRIRELLAIPERDRTDAQWDELNELEIRTAPGNRDTGRDPGRYPDRSPEKRHGGSGNGRRPERSFGQKNQNAPRPDAKPQEGRPEGVRSPRRQHRRPKRPPVDASGSGGG